MDRVCDVSRFFPLTLDVGCGRGHIAKATTSDITSCLVQCDMAENALVHIQLLCIIICYSLTRCLL